MPGALLSCMYDMSLLPYCKVLCRFWGLFYIYLSILPTALGLHNHKHIQAPKTVGTQTIFIEIMNKLMNRWFTCNIGLLTWSPVRNIKAGLKYVWQGYMKWVTANFLGLDNAKSYPAQQDMLNSVNFFEVHMNIAMSSETLPPNMWNVES